MGMPVLGSAYREEPFKSATLKTFPQNRLLKNFFRHFLRFPKKCTARGIQTVPHEVDYSQFKYSRETTGGPDSPSGLSSRKAIKSEASVASRMSEAGIGRAARFKPTQWAVHGTGRRTSSGGTRTERGSLRGSHIVAPCGVVGRRKAGDDPVTTGLNRNAPIIATPFHHL